ncbi:MAG: hypothetical protein JW727_00055 [Candidatus Aenigmarchaeota archaeon]|nr:hypothetical protein [Candidatus Aenigmarchaeota archaeon]
MNLRFVIDQEYDESLVGDECMRKAFGYKKGALQKMRDIYKTSMPYLKLTRKLYQASWNKINNSFSTYVEQTTSYNWFYTKYSCVLSVLHEGVSSWAEGPRIVRWWRENPYTMRRITAHELVLSHYFEIYKRHYSEHGLTDNQVWALAEIAAFALTSLTPEVKKFWPWGDSYYTDHNYPHIVPLQNKLKRAFLSRKSFDEYILKGIRLVKKYPRMSPFGIQ